jgi:hypothetical protein
LAQFHKATTEEAATEAGKASTPFQPSPEVPLRPCDFNESHPAYAAVWLKPKRNRAGRWEACPLCQKEWLDQIRRDQRLLNLLPGEAAWSKQALRGR